MCLHKIMGAIREKVCCSEKKQGDWSGAYSHHLEHLQSWGGRAEPISLQVRQLAAYCLSLHTSCLPSLD